MQINGEKWWCTYWRLVRQPLTRGDTISYDKVLNTLADRETEEVADLCKTNIQFLRKGGTIILQKEQERATTGSTIMEDEGGLGEQTPLSSGSPIIPDIQH